MAAPLITAVPLILFVALWLTQRPKERREPKNLTEIVEGME